MNILTACMYHVKYLKESLHLMYTFTAEDLGIKPEECGFVLKTFHRDLSQQSLPG